MAADPLISKNGLTEPQIVIRFWIMAVCWRWPDCDPEAAITP